MQKQYSHEQMMEIMETARELESTLDVSVKLGHGEALRITVEDLVRKYKHCIEIKDTENIEAFGKVLRYYLSEDEFIEYTK